MVRIFVDHEEQVHEVYAGAQGFYARAISSAHFHTAARSTARTSGCIGICKGGKEPEVTLVEGVLRLGRERGERLEPCARLGGDFFV